MAQIKKPQSLRGSNLRSLRLLLHTHFIDICVVLLKQFRLDTEQCRSNVVASRRGITTSAIAICSIPDDHIDPRRSGLFMARSVLRDIQMGGTNACSTS